MFNFDFLSKVFEIVFPQYFVYDFSKKCFSCYILLTDQISLPDFFLRLEIFDNMCIAIVCFPGCEVINFEINFTFLIKSFYWMTKKSRQNLNILRAKRPCKVK